PAGGAAAEAGIQPRRLDAALDAALHPGADHADDPDGGLQPPPFDRAATVPLAVVDARSASRAGADHQHARRAARGHYASRRKLAAGRAHSLPPRPHLGGRPLGPRGPRVRVLRRRQEGTRPPAVRRAAPAGALSRRIKRTMKPARCDPQTALRPLISLSRITTTAITSRT